MKKNVTPTYKTKLLHLFLKSMLFSFITFVVLGGLAVTIFLKKISLPKNVAVAATPEASSANEDLLNAPPDPITKNILVFGVDQGEARTDTILLVHFDSNTSRVAVVSIPRDTKVTWTSEQQDKATQLGRSYSYYSKITDMSSLGGIDNLRDFTIRSVEDMLNITIDNYVIINTSMLRDIVDKVGGVEVEVPRVMQYNDRSQDLHIDLQPGLQTLDGRQAEGLLRWRHNNNFSEQYAQGDLGRIETQQLFIKAFAKKVLAIRSIPQITGIITSVYNNLKTDISPSDALNYVAYTRELSPDNITFKTLPGEAARQDGLWYYLVDEDEALQYIDLIFSK